MEDRNLELWNAPHLLADTFPPQHSSNNAEEPKLTRSESLTMADPDSSYKRDDDSSWKNHSLDAISMQNCSDPVGIKKVDGRSMLGFSLTSPDLVICAGSPDIPTERYGSSPEILEKNRCSIELSLENGIDKSSAKYTHKTPSVKFSTVCQTYEKELSPESSFELLPPTPAMQDDLQKQRFPVISINAGSTNEAAALDGVNFLEDNCFSGGDVTWTDTIIGDGEGLSLYKTARYGNFSYMFSSLQSGGYIVDLHFAEIMFTLGPPGIRVFDVFIQEDKVVSGLDIYGQVGANKPLVVSGIKTFVNGDEGLFIRFEGIIGSPIVCGISVRKDDFANFKEAADQLEVRGITEVAEDNLARDIDEGEVKGEYQMLPKDHESQKKELIELRRAMEELKRENQLKNKECQEAWKSLKELQNELMRKSMHVGSLAFAIEGQVKEKGRWFSSLRDMTRKLKIMKMEHIKLSQEASVLRNCLGDINKISETIQSRINQHVDINEELKIKFIKGAKERKELYNKVLELKGNIRVFCRCRPLNNEEVAAGASLAIDFESAKDGELTVMSNGAPKKTFKFDAVFGPEADQVDVFEETAPLATSVLDGYNVCIFAYGQTGTGKTFTMEGIEEARGVNFRTLEKLFQIINERQKLFQYDISVSVLEVYNEQIRDLLVSGTQPGLAARRLEVRQAGEGMHHVPGLVEAHVSNMNEVWEVLQTGSNARAVGSTYANEHSSRSHCIHCVMVKGENLLSGECTKSKLWLVDLAGSERVAKTEVQGERLKETQNINRSLSALGDVISALGTKSPHIPFRNSKLTHLLQDSLGGDSKTLMFVQISPNENDLGETLCSLNFASRVRGIELGPAKRQLDNTEFLRYKQMVEKSKQDMKIKDMQMKMMEETIRGLDLKIKERDLKNKNLQDKVKELEAQLLIERKLARQHVDTKIAEQQVKQQQEVLNNTPMRPPLAARTLGTIKNLNDAASGGLMKEQVNLFRPLIENSSKPLTPLPLTDRFDLLEKENNPDMAENLQLPKRTGRASICAGASRIPVISAPRRNSLIPLPSAPNSTQPSRPLLPLPPIEANIEEEEDEFFPEQTVFNSPKAMKSGSKKLNSILRRSLHKKIQMKSPMQQHLRRGVNVGMEKVRVSIGSRGRMGHKVLLGNARKGGTKENHQKLIQREKERGWNIGTSGRTAI
ncbi:hypothetical protein SLE2022_312070 [Rubroshorea leprosula]